MLARVYRAGVKPRINCHQLYQGCRVTCSASPRRYLHPDSTRPRQSPLTAGSHWQQLVQHQQAGNHDHREKSRKHFSMGLLLVGVSAVLGAGAAWCEAEEAEEAEECEAQIKAAMHHSKNTDQGRDVVGTEKSTAGHPTGGRVDAGTHTGTDRDEKTGAGLEKKSCVFPQGDKGVGLEEAVRRSRVLLRKVKEQVGAPGIVVGVSVDGRMIWAEGMGFADLENNVRCTPDTVMRIASISKPITMTAVARLWEQGKLDLDAPIQKYVPKFPIKKFEGEEVTITTRQLLSHQSGIRHYQRREDHKDKKNKDKEEAEEPSNSKSADTEKTSEQLQEESEHKHKKAKSKKKKKRKKEEEEDEEFSHKEYFIKEEVDSVEEALDMFKDDELFFKPGTGYLYTTHGFTLVSAVVEGAAGQPFPDVLARLFHDLGLNHTYLDKNDPIIHHRARNYVRNKEGRLRNAPYVDNSYKWAGGGLLSNVHDLCKFGNMMLYASQQQDGAQAALPGYIKAATVKQLWTPVPGTPGKFKQDHYGLGWVAKADGTECGFCRQDRYQALHSGAAVGASSVLVVLPREQQAQDSEEGSGGGTARGVVVTVMVNMQSVNLYNTARDIAQLFERLR